MNAQERNLVPTAGDLALAGTVPPYRMELLFASDQEPRGHGYGLQYSITISNFGDVGLVRDLPDDPSTIYSTLPVSDCRHPEDIAKLSYFPSYSKMDAFQRGKYILWLRDVRQQIDIGFVFVYYYGLERHLVYGNFDAAFNEILLLRKHHDNGSFQGYSASALVHSCLLRKRLDKLQQLYKSPEFDYFGNSNLLIAYYDHQGLQSNTMFLLAFRISGVNRRYAKLNPDLYKTKITEVLNTEYGCRYFPISSEFKIGEIEGIPYPIFANISFPPSVRTPRLPNFLHHPQFVGTMKGIFSKVHQAVKEELKNRKRNA